MKDEEKASPLTDMKKLMSGVESMAKSVISQSLAKLLAGTIKLRELKSKAIIQAPPVILQKGQPIIHPRTINVIQGQAGVHKSRLAEFICSAMMKRSDCENELLGITRNNLDPNYAIVYVDTERNLTEQFPAALQRIQQVAGYSIEADPPNFEFISLLEEKRVDRFTVLAEYLEHLKTIVDKPLLVVLDVLTDCVEDFNQTGKSMELIDMMNVMINDYDVVFLCLIHENPGSNKARGHLGTELINKASTVMQIGFEPDAKNNDTELLKLKFLKCRSSQRYAPIYMKYCQEERGLVLADEKEVSSLLENRKRSASIPDVIELLETYLGDGLEMTRIELLNKLMEDFGVSMRTIEERLKEIIEAGTILHNTRGEKSQQCYLVKERKDKELYYSLKPIDDSISTQILP